MAPPSQKADQRPISFVLHDTAKGTPPVEVPLVIRPEDLTRTDVSRLATVQTLGGAWTDNFGPGLPTVQIAGHTGWGGGNRPDGITEFQTLYDTVFRQWHALRAEALNAGLDPDKVKLIFADGLDDFTWVVAPQNFILKRNRSRPLLSNYQINLSYVSSDVKETMDALEALKAAAEDDPITVLAKESGLESLASSIQKATDAINAEITKFLGPIQKAVDDFLRLTNKVLKSVNKIIRDVTSVTATLTNGIMGIATSLTRAAANITHMIHSVIALPKRIKAQFMRLASAFENVFCLLSNVLKPRRFLPNYDDLYGASMCSSTAGGSPISPYDTENPFPALYPARRPDVSVSAEASNALNRIMATDPVLKPLPPYEINKALKSLVNGVSLPG